MPTNGVPIFRVEWLGPTREKARHFLVRAKELGIFDSVAQDLLNLEQALAHNPTHSADFLFHTKAVGGLVCRRTIFFFNVHFLVFESQHLVVIQRIDALPPHPLAEV
jgi:hypothetical protein